MENTSAPLERKVTFREWLWQIVGDLRSLTRGPIYAPAVGRHPEFQEYGLWYEVKFVTTPVQPIRPMLSEIGTQFVTRWYYPLEVLIAHRSPFAQVGCGPNSPLCTCDNWLSWTREAAQRLFAYPGWVRFAAYLFNPFSAMYHDQHELHTDLAAEVWSKLTDWSLEYCRNTWIAQKSYSELRSYGPARPKFWATEVEYHRLGFPAYKKKRSKIPPWMNR